MYVGIKITRHLVSLSKYLSYGLDLNFLQLTAVLFEPLSGIWLLGESKKKKSKQARKKGGKKSPCTLINCGEITWSFNRVVRHQHTLQIYIRCFSTVSGIIKRGYEMMPTSNALHQWWKFYIYYSQTILEEDVNSEAWLCVEYISGWRGSQGCKNNGRALMFNLSGQPELVWHARVIKDTASPF